MKTRSLTGELAKAGTPPPPKNMVYIAASRADEVSFDNPNRGGLATTAWRECMLGKAKDTDSSGALSVEEIASCAQSEITKMLESSPDILGQHMTIAGNRDFVPSFFVQGTQVASVASELPLSTSSTATVTETVKPIISTPAPVAASPLRGTTVTMSRLRKVIAARMVESLQVSAQHTTVIEVDVTKIARLRDRSKASFEAREGVKLSFLPFFAVAACEALKQHPVLNSSVEGDQIIYHGAEHLGVAVDTERGLLVPVIHNAGDLNMGGVARKIADLAARTRDNKVTPDELGGGTFTLTNTGSRGALFDTPIINQPQVAILGLGAVVKRPMVVKGDDGGESIAIRSMVYLGLSYDHRVVDGADAARFLVTLKERLEGGAFEADLGL
jgi:2-oxoglutarate dehydrogenase E2 component (dihydrolipoamide succinyltransferase)